MSIDGLSINTFNIVKLTLILTDDSIKLSTKLSSVIADKRLTDTADSLKYALQPFVNNKYS